MTRLLRPTISSCACAATFCLTAACGGGGDNGGQKVTPPDTPPSITNIRVEPGSVTGGATAQGTVTVAPAPTAGTAVALESSSGAATVPPTVTVNSGATTAPFTVNTTAVATVTAVTLRGTLNGSQTTTLTIMPAPPTFTANFTVRSLTDAFRKTGSTSTKVAGREAGSLDTCPLVNENGNPRLSCVFDGAPSTSPNGISEYRWRWAVGSAEQAKNNVEVSFQPPADTCGLFGAAGFNNSLQLVQMQVTLVIRDNAGQLSAAKVNQNVSVFPNGLCGSPF